MNRNLFLAFTLSVIVYVGWFMWVEKTQPRRPQAQTQKSVQPVMAKAAPELKAAPPVPQTAFSAAPDNLRTPEADMTFSPKGAALTGYKFYGPVGTAELVHSTEPGFFSTMPELAFSLKEKQDKLITFSASPQKGVEVLKTYKWDGGGLNSLEISVVNNTKKPIVWPEWDISLGPGIGTVLSEKKENTGLWKAACAIQEAGRKHPTLKNLAKETPQVPWLWAGVHNRYFLAALLPDNWTPGELVFSQSVEGKVKAPAMTVAVPAEEIAAGKTRLWRTEFYLGPKDYRKLTALGRGLDRSVEFGFFGPLGKLAMRILYFNHKLTGNYGWAIILLTLLVQAVMFPLTLKSVRATLIMKKLQPHLQQIQAKYKDNPQRLNQEMMQLYKKHGANPLGGCLPMLIQIPVFFALFTALRNSWDLHGAAFIWWVRDLSAKDPYYVLPLVMGGIMFVQQKMTLSTGGDPTQAAVMKWMPLIFTFMFLSFPSGLVLYWLTSSLIGFGQQIYMQKKMEA